MDATAETSRLEQFVSQLAIGKTNPKQIWTRCPAHDDKHASLSVGLGKDGNTRSLPRRMFRGAGVPGDASADVQPVSHARGVENRANLRLCSAEGELLYQVGAVRPQDFRHQKPDG